MKEKMYSGFPWKTGEDNPFKGKKHTQESLALMSKASKGRVVSEETRDKISKSNLGTGNSMYGKTYYGVWLEKYGEAKAQELHELKRQRNSVASKGKNNPMYGKPTPQGSGNGWSGWYHGWYFRSLRELTYVVNLDKQGIKWQTAEYIKIKYNFNGSERTYRPDFLVGGTLIEIKPLKMVNTPCVSAKRKAALEYCELNGLKYEILDPGIIESDQLLQLYQQEIVKFTVRYEAKFKEYHETNLCSDAGNQRGW